MFLFSLLLFAWKESVKMKDKDYLPVPPIFYISKYQKNGVLKDVLEENIDFNATDVIKRLNERNETKKTLLFLEKSCEMKSLISACLLLARINEFGAYGTKQNLEKSQRLYKRVSNIGYTEADVLLSFFYKHYSANNIEALLNQELTNNYVESILPEAYSYRTGVLRPFSPKEAAKKLVGLAKSVSKMREFFPYLEKDQFEKVFKDKNGKKLIFTDDIKKALELAFDYYAKEEERNEAEQILRKLYEKDDSDLIYLIAYLQLWKKPKEADLNIIEEANKRLMKQDNIFGDFVVAQNLFDFFDGPSLMSRASELLSHAIDYSSSYINMFRTPQKLPKVHYIAAKYSVEKDIPTILNYYKSAAKDDYPPALSKLGNLIVKKKLPQVDSVAAYNYLARVCENIPSIKIMRRYALEQGNVHAIGKLIDCGMLSFDSFKWPGNSTTMDKLNIVHGYKEHIMRDLRNSSKFSSSKTDIKTKMYIATHSTAEAGLEIIDRITEKDWELNNIRYILYALVVLSYALNPNSHGILVSNVRKYLLCCTIELISFAALFIVFIKLIHLRVDRFFS